MMAVGADLVREPRLPIDHRAERREQAIEALAGAARVRLEDIQDLGQRLDRRHAEVRGLAPDDVVFALFPRRERDARQRGERGIDPHELARLCPGPVDHDEGDRPIERDLAQVGRGHAVAAREEEIAGRLAGEGRGHDRIAGEIDADPQGRVGQRQVRHARRADAHAALVRMLEHEDMRPRRQDRQVSAIADDRGAPAAIAHEPSGWQRRDDGRVADSTGQPRGRALP